MCFICPTSVSRLLTVIWRWLSCLWYLFCVSDSWPSMAHLWKRRKRKEEEEEEEEEAKEEEEKGERGRRMVEEELGINCRGRWLICFK